MPNSCKLVVPRLGVLSLYPSNLQCNGLRSLCVCLLPRGSAENGLLLLSAPLLPLSFPLCHPVTPLSLSSQTVCHLIQLFLKADTLTQLTTKLRCWHRRASRIQPYAKSGIIKRRRRKRCLIRMKVWERANAYAESSVRRMKCWRLSLHRVKALLCLFHLFSGVLREASASAVSHWFTVPLRWCGLLLHAGLCVPATCLSAAFTGRPPDTKGPG